MSVVTLDRVNYLLGDGATQTAACTGSISPQIYANLTLLSVLHGADTPPARMYATRVHLLETIVLAWAARDVQSMMGSHDVAAAPTQTQSSA